jgi:glutathione S-transferase
VPYRIEKVTMFCYGEKEAWYKKKVPSGMLPALELDGRLHTESDVILSELENAFGPLYKGMTDPAVVPLRRLERMLFGAWCNWLCRQHWPAFQEKSAQKEFERAVALVEEALASTPGDFFLEEGISTADVIFTPYIERMSASLFYYKGYVLRCPEQNPNVPGGLTPSRQRKRTAARRAIFTRTCTTSRHKWEAATRTTSPSSRGANL